MNSKHLNKVIVSTDDKEIAEVAKGCGAEVPFLRPKELAMDNSPTIDVILHALEWFDANGEHIDIIALLEPTSPLRRKTDIDNAIELFVANIDEADSLVSVGRVHLEEPHILKQIEGGYVKSYLDAKAAIDIQMPKANIAYFPYGVIYIAKVSALRKYKTFYMDRTIPYFIERWQNYEIDDMIDWICCEAIKHYSYYSEKI
jgi:CMP-N-acetylneuraminic acid synthetase